jgi:hypothetical protein
MYWSSTASADTAVTAGGANKNTACCIAKAECSGYTCPAGYKTMLGYCTTSAVTAGTCSSNCCELDNLKCAYYASSITCASTHLYVASTHAGTTVTAGGANKNTACCTPKLLCADASVVCNAGYEKRCAADMTLYQPRCSTTSFTVAGCHSNCCNPVPEKCGGLAGLSLQVACIATGGVAAANRYWDSAKAGVTFTTNKAVECCSTRSVCTGYSCAAGYKIKAAHASIYCTGTSTTCTLTQQLCCDVDSTKCLGMTAVACADEVFTADYCTATTTQAINTRSRCSHYWDSLKLGTAATTTNKASACCTAKATCAAGTCSPGYMKKEPYYCSTSANTEASSMPLVVSSMPSSVKESR